MEWFFPGRDPTVENEERAKERSAIYTDQGEYATGLFQIAAIPDHIFYYSNESEEDQNLLLQKPEGKDEEEWHHLPFKGSTDHGVGRSSKGRNGPPCFILLAWRGQKSIRSAAKCGDSPTPVKLLFRPRSLLGGGPFL